MNVPVKASGGQAPKKQGVGGRGEGVVRDRIIACPLLLFKTKINPQDGLFYEAIDKGQRNAGR
jgi:hypothetical protein